MERLEQDEERFDESTQERILHIAAEFQREEASTLSRNQLELAAAEAGIDPKHVRRAIESLRAKPTPDLTQLNLDRDRFYKFAVIGSVLAIVLLSTGRVPLVPLVAVVAVICVLLARQDPVLLRSLFRRCGPVILALTPTYILMAGRFALDSGPRWALLLGLQAVAILLAYQWARRMGQAENRGHSSLSHRV
jgi:hypothetical protein